MIESQTEEDRIHREQIKARKPPGIFKRAWNYIGGFGPEARQTLRPPYSRPGKE